MLAGVGVDWLYVLTEKSVWEVIGGDGEEPCPKSGISNSTAAEEAPEL